MSESTVTRLHPITELFPPMSESELSDLTEDIRANGLREPVWIDRDGAVIDGRHRVTACRELGIVPSTRTYTGDDVTAFVVSLNLKRRHLNESQRAMVGARLASMRPGRPAVTTPIGGVSQPQAATMLNVSERAIQRAATVQRDAEPEVVHAVESGRMAVSLAADVAKAEPDVQREVAQAEKPREKWQGHKGVLINTGEDDWPTPPHIIEAAVSALGAIDLDPCAGTAGRVPATVRFSEADDGLSREWRGAVYMNPPYGRSIGDWTRKLIAEYESCRVSAFVALVPARTDTEWFQCFRDCLLCFIRGRLKFGDAEQGAPFPSVAVYAGQDWSAFRSAFERYGDVFRRME